jgi:hypothetical protein
MYVAVGVRIKLIWYRPARRHFEGLTCHAWACEHTSVSQIRAICLTNFFISKFYLQPFLSTSSIIYKYFSIIPFTTPRSNASTLFPFPSIVSAIHTAFKIASSTQSAAASNSAPIV